MFDTTETNYGLRQVQSIYKNPMAELRGQMLMNNYPGATLNNTWSENLKDPNNLLSMESQAKIG